MRSARCFAGWAAVAWFSDPGAVAQAASPDDFRTVNVNYVYASTLGFGGYSLAGLSADVYTLPLSHSFLLGDDGLVLRVTLPVQFGIYSFRGTDTDGTPISLNQQSLALVPGAELQIPVGPHLLLKPFVNFGAAYAFGVSQGVPDAWVYAAGARAVSRWQIGAYTLAVGGGALYAGDRAMGPGFHEQYTALEAGVELRHPLGFSIRGIAPDVGVYAAAYEYPQPLQFTRFLAPPLSVRNQGEVGMTLGTVQPLDMLWLGNTRIGAGYVFGDGLQVWHVVFGLPF